MNDSIPDRCTYTAACNKGKVYCKTGLVLVFSLIVTTLFGQNWYPDLDGDGFGNGFVAPVISPTQPPDHVLNPLDCNDAFANNSVWSKVGASDVSSSSITMTKLVIAPDGTPFALYQDFATTEKYVRKFSGSAWTAVGGSPITTTIDPVEMQQPDLAVNSLGEAYICFLDYDAVTSSNNKVTVLKFDGLSGQWGLVGSRRFSAELQPDINIRMTLHNDVPYVIFGEGSARTMKVMKFDAGSWVTVGGSLMGLASEHAPTLTARGNFLYAAVVDRNAFFDGDTWQTVILTCDLSAGVPSWTQVGATAFPHYITPGTETPRVAVSSTGIPYVACYDDALNQVIVQKYESGSWTPVGPSGSAYVHAGIASYIDLAVDNQNVPVVAFRDHTAGQIVLKKLGASGTWDAGSTPSINGILLSLAISPYTNAPYLEFKDSGTEKAVVYSVAPQIDLPVITSITSPEAFLCSGEDATVSLTGNLNHAARWKWYSGTCGDALAEVTPDDLVTRTSITVSPGVTTTYYVRGEGNCISAAAICTAFTVGVTPRPVWYEDSDGDGLGNATASTRVNCDPQTGYVTNNADCNDNSLNPSTWDIVGGSGFATGPNATGAANVIATAFDNGNTPFVAYRDNSTTPAGKATVMRFDGSGWVPVGAAGFSSGVATFVNIAFDGSTPYVAYIDGGKVNVKKFTSGNWLTVGTTNFSTGTATSLSMAMNINDGTPYVVYTDGTTSPINRATVMRFNGTLWEVVGVANFTTGAATSNSITIDSRGTPYVSFADGAATTRLSVMKFNGTTWTVVGAQGISAGVVTYTSIRVDSRGVPYVAYRDNGVGSGRVVVNKYTGGTTWPLVGAMGGVSTGVASYVSLALDKSGTPYVSYVEGSVTGRAMKYNGASWMAVGASVMPAGVSTADDMSLAMNASGVPYVALRSVAPVALANRISVMKMGPAANLPVATDITSTAQHFCPGTITSATLTVVGSLNDATEWKWYKGSCGGGAALTPASATTVDITAESTPGTDVTYYVRGEGACVTSTICADNLMIRTRINPAITSGPMGDNTVCEDATGVPAFTITTVGDGVAYQWEKNGVVDGAVTGASYGFPGAVTTANDAIYKVTVTGTCATPAPLADDAKLTVREKPEITGIPSSPGTFLQDRVVCEDATGIPPFEITATGHGLQYQWEKDGTLLPNTTTSHGISGAITTADAGIYKITVTGSCATATPITDELQLEVREKPEITGIPSSPGTFLQDRVACEDATVAPFEITAAGYGLQYRWEKDGTLLPSTTPGYTISGTVTTATAGIYKVTVTGYCATSAPVTDEAELTINELPRIVTSTVTDRTICEDAPGVTPFGITVSGTGPFGYQWEKDGAVEPLFTGSSHTLPDPITTADAGTYRVTVTGACPTATPVTAAALLTVDTKPTITGTLSDVIQCEGTNVTFSTSFAGTGTQGRWQKDGVDLGVAGNTLALTNISLADDATYTVVATNACDNTGVSRSVMLTVDERTVITTQPADANACDGASEVRLSVSATGTGLNYQWRTNNSASGTWRDIAGENSRELVVRNVNNSMHNRSYHVVVRGTCSSDMTSSDARLLISAVGAVTLRRDHPATANDPAATVVCEGSETTFTGVVTGTATGYVYQWQRNNGSGWTDIAGETDRSMTLSSISQTVSNTSYRVVAGNPGCTPVPSAATLMTVNALSNITAHPADAVTCEGGTAQFTVSATGTALAYQWQMHNGSAWENLPGAINSALDLLHISSIMNEYRYRVIVDAAGCPPITSDVADLTVSRLPDIIAPPAPAEICMDQNAVFTVVAEGTDLSYAWEENRGSEWTELAGENAASLLLRRVPPGMNGYLYRVRVISPGCTSITSGGAQLIINTQPGQRGCSQSLLISEGVSPNGDDQLDRWIIEGIELYPNNNVKLYNVWGDLVFERKGYDNELHAWRGETNKGLKIGQEAPDGTYFYFIDLGNDDAAVLRGFVVLKR